MKNLLHAIALVASQRLWELLTGVDPSNETLALEKERLPAKNEPPLWKTFWGLCASAGHLWTEESVVAAHILSSCNANCKIGCSFVQSKRLSLVTKSVKYNWGYKQNRVSKIRASKITLKYVENNYLDFIGKSTHRKVPSTTVYMAECWSAGKCPNRICMHSIWMHTSLHPKVPQPTKQSTKSSAQGLIHFYDWSDGCWKDG